MAFTRAHLYEDKERQLSYYAHAVAHPARTRIIRQLLQHDFLSVDRLSARHPLAISTMSQHLKILRDGGLVDCWEEFPFTYYRINLKNLERLKREFRLFAESI